MTRLELLHKVKDRRKQAGITLENLAEVSHLGYKHYQDFAGIDVN